MEQVGNRRPVRPCRERARGVALHVLAFALPVALLCAWAAAAGVRPFGPTSMLTEDLMYQYADFYEWYRRVLAGQESLFYTFSTSLGNNAWGLWSYYLASPFNLIALLFPLERLGDAIFIISAVKLGLIGVSSTFYLRRRFSLPGGIALALALCFSSSLWIATQLRNPMWMDAMILLPLVALAAWRCVTRGRWAALLAALVCAIASCWYTGYMMVLFTVCVSLLEWFVAPADGSGRLAGTRAVSLVCGVLCCALLLSAWTLYPTVAAQLGSWSPLRTVALLSVSAVVLLLGLLLLDGRLPDGVVRGLARAALVVVGVGVLALGGYYAVRLLGTGSLGEVAARVTPFRVENLVSSPFLGTYQDKFSPQLYVGYLPLVGSVALVADGRLARRLRVAALAAISLAVLSVAFTVLYVAWCGFAVPHGFHSRTAFLAVFAAMWSCALYLSRRPVAAPSRSAVAGVLLIVALSVPCSLAGPVHAGRLIVVGAVLMALYLALLSSRLRAPARVALSALVFAELALSGASVWPALYSYTQEQHESYVTAARGEMAALRELDGGFYRVEKTYTRAADAALNEGLSQGFYRLASYVSGSNPAAIALLNSLGYSHPGEFSTGYRTPVLPSDTLLGVRYVFSRAPVNALSRVDAPFLAEGDLLFENPDALSVGYTASADVTSFSPQGAGDPFACQNQLASALLGHDVELYAPLASSVVADEAGTRSWRVEVPAGTLACSWLASASEVPYRYAVDDPTAAWTADAAPGGVAWDNTRFSHAVRMLGDASDEPREVVVTVQSAEGAAGTATGALPEDAACLFYGMDMGVYRELVRELSQEQLEVTEWSGARLAGTFAASGEKDGLVLTVPHDAGWTILLDGEEVEGEPAAGGALTFVRVPGAGAHELEMSYVPPMLRAGCAVTLVALAALTARAWHLRSPGERRDRGASALQ